MDDEDVFAIKVENMNLRQIVSDQTAMIRHLQAKVEILQANNSREIDREVKQIIQKARAK
jgi:hypothetical protein